MMKLLSLSFAALSLLFSFHALAFEDGLLENGNFELGPKPSSMNGTVVRDHYAIPGWEIGGFVEYITAGHKQGDMLLVVPEGACAVRLGNEAYIRQSVAVATGMYYAITFSAARTCAQEERINITVPPETDVFPVQTLYSSSGWDSYSWAFKATSAVAHIFIHNPGVEEDAACGPLIDSVAIKALYPPRATNSKESAIAQVARTIPGKLYALTFAVGDASNACTGSMVVEAFAGRDTLKVPYESKGTGGFKRAVLRFTAVSERTRVVFLSTFYSMRSDDFSSLCGPVIDDVKLLSVHGAPRAKIVV